MKTFTLKSPAKLNLYLRVLGKRADGFHEIKTIFELINLFDEISFSENRTGTIKIICDHPQVPTGSKNLVYRAAMALREKTGVKKGAIIRLTKRIPVAAGLAGGSSNAATALIGLNRLWNLKLKEAELEESAGQLGSDITFFLKKCSWALGEGRGEIVQKLSIRAKYWHILVTPKIKMKTPDVYKALNLKALTNKKDSDNILIHYLQERDINNIRDSLSNDLEYSILTIAPKLAGIGERMKAIGVKGVSFSGSGPSFFGLTDSKREAEHLCDLLQKRYGQVFVVRTW